MSAHHGAADHSTLWPSFPQVDRKAYHSVPPPRTKSRLKVKALPIRVSSFPLKPRCALRPSDAGLGAALLGFIWKYPKPPSTYTSLVG